MNPIRFKRCRLLPGNVRNKELTIRKRLLLSLLRKHKTANRTSRYLTREQRNRFIHYRNHRQWDQNVALSADLPAHSLIDKMGSTIYYIHTTTMERERAANKKETRSDVLPVRLLYRASIPKAREHVGHFRVGVNGRIRTTHYLIVRTGDIIFTIARTTPDMQLALLPEITVENIARSVKNAHSSFNTSKVKCYRLLQTEGGCKLLLGRLREARRTSSNAIAPHSRPTYGSEQPITLLHRSFHHQDSHWSTVYSLGCRLRRITKYPTAIAVPFLLSPFNELPTDVPHLTTSYNPTNTTIVLASFSHYRPRVSRWQYGVCAEFNHRTKTAVLC